MLFMALGQGSATCSSAAVFLFYHSAAAPLAQQSRLAVQMGGVQSFATSMNEAHVGSSGPHMG